MSAEIVHTVESTRDEFGNERWLVTDANGDWVAGPYDSRAAAMEAAIALGRGALRARAEAKEAAKA